MKDSDETLTVFTTRVDTIYGTTFLWFWRRSIRPFWKMSRERNAETGSGISTRSSIMNEIERTSTTNEKTGVFIAGDAINLFTHKEMLIYIADYVLMCYVPARLWGTSAHDQRL